MTRTGKPPCRTATLLVLATAASLCLRPSTFGQTAPPAAREERAPAPKPLPDPVTGGAADAVPPALSVAPVPITLPTALRLALIANLDVAQARQVVAQAQAALLQARVIAIPNLNGGSQYVHHEGTIQKTEGNIIFVNRDSLFVGFGPSLSFQTVEAIYSPLIATQLANATRAGLQRVSNDTLLAVTDAYLAVLRARRRLARLGETLDYLESERPSPSRAQSIGLLPLVRNFVEVGGKEAFRSDLERMRVEVLRRKEERAAALLEFGVASAELARLLRLDPEIPLLPAEDFRYPIPLPGGEWADRPTEELVAFALNGRPEMAETQALVQAALARVKTAKMRPLMPNLVMNYSWGDFGGGPDLNPPIVTTSSTGKVTVTNQPGFGPSGRIEHFAPRTDFDVSLMWRLQNMGLGNVAEVRQQQAAYRQQELRRLQAVYQVMTQVVQAQELVQGWRQRLEISRAALFNPAGEPAGPVYLSLRYNFERIRGAEGRPLEVLDSVRGLNDLLEAYASSLTDYERARFRLLVALGIPAQSLIDPSAPLPPHSAAACDASPVESGAVNGGSHGPGQGMNANSPAVQAPAALPPPPARTPVEYK